MIPRYADKMYLVCVILVKLMCRFVCHSENIFTYLILQQAIHHTSATSRYVDRETVGLILKTFIL